MAWPVGFDFYYKRSSVFLGDDVGTGSLLAWDNLISVFRQILSNSRFYIRLSHFIPSDYLGAEGKRGGSCQIHRLLKKVIQQGRREWGD
jgi:hypothetical protein